jgi:DNA-binding HxlR family transcriptional regulator
MTSLRSYEDPCGIARALDLVGERWALLIVRELVFGAKRFSELRAGLPDASPNVLSQRLRELEAAGVLQRRKALYELTDWGRELHPILLQLGRWGARSAQRSKGALSVSSLMVALEATFVPAQAAELQACYELRLREERFNVQVARSSIAIASGSARRPDAVIETDAATLRALVFGDRKLSDAQVELHGDARIGRQFFRLFARPARAVTGSQEARHPR